MESSSKILYEGGEGEITEKKSRFIAHIFPVKTEAEAIDRINEIKKKYYDARHNCFAYTIGDHGEIERCSDDGEPSGTAGRPMLEVLKRQGIHDTVAVVTRYFGGTLLGTGGLLRAYTEAVQEGLLHCSILDRMMGYQMSIDTGYNEVGKLQYMARSKGLHELSCDYADKVRMELLVPADMAEAIEDEIDKITSANAKVEKTGPVAYGILRDKVILIR